jgi:hypothetical protein
MIVPNYYSCLATKRMRVEIAVYTIEHMAKSVHYTNYRVGQGRPKHNSGKTTLYEFLCPGGLSNALHGIASSSNV